MRLLWKALVCHNSQQPGLKKFERLYWLFLLSSSLLLALPLNLLFSGPVYSLRKTDTLKKIKTFKILDFKDIFSTFLFLGKRTVNLRYSHVWCLLEKGKLLSGKKKKVLNKNFKGLLQNLEQTARDGVWVVLQGQTVTTMCPSLFLPEAGSRGGFSAPSAALEHLLLCTAAPVAKKFYGAMAWLGFYPFCKPKTGNMQSKMHMCIFFDIHREHSCLLPGARGVGMREMILQSLQLSPQSAFEEIWKIDMILSAILAWSK